MLEYIYIYISIYIMHIWWSTRAWVSVLSGFISRNSLVTRNMELKCVYPIKYYIASSIGIIPWRVFSLHLLTDKSFPLLFYQKRPGHINIIVRPATFPYFRFITVWCNLFLRLDFFCRKIIKRHIYIYIYIYVRAISSYLESKKCNMEGRVNCLLYSSYFQIILIKDQQ